MLSPNQWTRSYTIHIRMLLLTLTGGSALAYQAELRLGLYTSIQYVPYNGTCYAATVDRLKAHVK